MEEIWVRENKRQVMALIRCGERILERKRDRRDITIVE